MKQLILFALLLAMSCVEPAEIKCTVWAIGNDNSRTWIGEYVAIDNQDASDQCDIWADEMSDICSVWCDCK